MGHSPNMASGVESFQFETNNLFVSCNKAGFVAGNMGLQWLSRASLKLLSWFYYLSAVGGRNSLQGVCLYSSYIVRYKCVPTANKLIGIWVE